MLKRLWIFLTEPNHHAESHARGFVLLLLLSSLILVSPLIYHHLFTPKELRKVNNAELEILKQNYQVYCDSIDSVQYTIRKQRYSSSFDKTGSKYYQNKDKHFSYSNAEKTNSSNTDYVFRNEKSSNSEKTNHFKNEPRGLVQPKERVKFSLNTATLDELKAVKGIGTTYAQRIIKFRDRLGGFYSPNQLYEVYGLDSIVVKECMLHLIDEPLSITKKVDLNKDEFKLILKHPYLEYEDVKEIFKYRPLSSERLCKVLPEKCEKLKPYVEY